LAVAAPEAPLPRAHLGALEIEVAAWPETDDPVRLVAGALAAAGAARGRLAVGERVGGPFPLRLQDALAGAAFSPASSLTRQLRMRKDPEEVQALARAAAAGDRGGGPLPRPP